MIFLTSFRVDVAGTGRSDFQGLSQQPVNQNPHSAGQRADEDDLQDGAAVIHGQGLS